MKRTARIKFLVSIMALALASCTAWAMQAGIALTMNGSVISQDIQMVKGRAYVPLNDVAKILDMTAVKMGNTYQLTRAGGAYTSRAATGKMGADISSGTWTFKLTSIRQVTEYKRRYGTDTELLTPKEADDTLILATCRLKNSAREKQDIYFDRNSAGNTALTDDQEHGYVPFAYDSRNSDYSSTRILPGAAHDFRVLFSVPKSANLKDLIYTVEVSGQDKITEFRVSLTP